MIMKPTGILALLIVLMMGAAQASACTSAIISGRLTRDGRPLMWKNRDTNDLNNRIKRVEAHDGLYEFVALFDARDMRDTAAWMGMNEHGFAIMNTASYNLNHDDVPASMMDCEGVLMRAALERCVTVSDFENLLDTLPRPLRVEANFGVLDAAGHAAYFETGNFKYVKYDIDDAPAGYLVRTNYSYSGDVDKGAGYIREKNALTLLAPHIAACDIEPATFTEELSRTFYNSQTGDIYNATTANAVPEWVVDQDFIPRRISSASVVIEGVKKGESPSLTTMWVALGYPPCAVVQPVWTGENGVPQSLVGCGPNNHAPECDIVNARKAEVFSIKRGNGNHYINMPKLYNSEGTGYCQTLRQRAMESYKRGKALRDARH